MAPDGPGLGQGLKLAGIALVSAILAATLVVLVGEALFQPSQPTARDPQIQLVSSTD
ncbi:hypothetical protein [Brevundimonas sp. SL130]|uniref:hypothetical protein n=1 Tax=Brevundimonas sp. SL130 TaxID=2995143 RepID=UPI00226D2E0C|nr:hypothetical protein [Brevundimonas sp. SL130]WAC60124.1 hypothetical protein OU998_01375 [Brevundimonas sp. SL130]